MLNYKLNQNNNEEHDLIFDSSGQLETVSDVEYISQKVKQILLTVQGEWFRNTKKGIPYFTHIFVKPVDINQIRIILRTSLERDPVLKQFGVQKFTFENFQINSKDRTLKCILSIELKDGSTIKINSGVTI